MGHARPLLLLAMVVACGSTEAEPRRNDSAGGVGGGGDAASGGGGANGSAGAGSNTAGASGGGQGGESGALANSGGEGGSAEVTKGSCGSSKLAGCYRGLYVSPYTDHIGKVTFAGDDLAYAHLLGDSAKEQRLLDFITAEQVDSLSLYNLNVILADAALSEALESFMARAREAGVLRIEAIGAEGTAIWDNIHDFHHERSAFDGLVTEMEFWAGAVTFDAFIDTLEYVRSLGWAEAASGASPTLTAYVGWPEAGQVDAMVPLLDRVYVHVYVNDAADSYAYGSARFDLFAAANQKLGTAVDVWPIYSAEDSDWAAGDEAFMGEWLRDHSLAQAELEFLGAWEAARIEGSELIVSGHQYYEYYFLDKYLD